jgi:hypothetical protein
MKKFLALVVVAAALTSVVGCGDPAPTAPAPKTGGMGPAGGAKPGDTKK